MPFGSSAENKRLEKAAFTQLISLGTTGSSFLLSVAEITLHNRGHSAEWLHLSLAAEVGVIPLLTLKYMLLKDPN